MLGIAAIGKYAHSIPSRHVLANIFKNTGCFMDSSTSDGYSYHKFYFRIYGTIILNVLHVTREKKIRGDKWGDIRNQRTGSPPQVHLFQNIRSKWSSTHLALKDGIHHVETTCGAEQSGDVGKPIRKSELTKSNSLEYSAQYLCIYMYI